MQPRTQMGSQQSGGDRGREGGRRLAARVTPAPGLGVRGAETSGAMEAHEPTAAERTRSITFHGIVRRRGVVGWWLSLTAPAWPRRTPPIAERERLRKAELTSFSILAVFLLLVSLVSNSMAHPATAQAVIIMGAGLVVAGVLNRRGNTQAAAYLVPALLMLVIAAAIVRSAGGLQLALLPAYDLFALPVFLISLIGDRRATWLFAGAALVFILVDFSVQPHAHLTAPGAQGFDDIRYAIGQVTWWGEVNRHVAIVLFAALFGWLGARSVDLAIRRADRAEEVAALEHAVADQKRQLDVGIQQILETHIRVANGDFSARAPASQQNVLWQIAASLNNLLARLQRAGNAEYQLFRTETALRRLVAALDEERLGKRSMWPAPTGTAVDTVVMRLARRAASAAQAGEQASAGSGGLGSGPVITVQVERAPGASRYQGSPSAVGGSDGENPRTSPRNPPPWMRQSRAAATGDLTADASRRDEAAAETAAPAPNPPWL